jgi:hypothetical protein
VSTTALRLSPFRPIASAVSPPQLRAPVDPRQQIPHPRQRPPISYRLPLCIVHTELRQQSARRLPAGILLSADVRAITPNQCGLRDVSYYVDARQSIP